MYRELALSRGNPALVDEDVFAWASRMNWGPNGDGYARTTIRTEEGWKKVSLHVLIMGKRDGLEIDHVNGNRLDCRRANLRFVTHAQNLQNRVGPQKDSRTGVRGVSVYPGGRFRAQVNVDGVPFRLGIFDTLDGAAQAVTEARRQLMTHSVECQEVTMANT